VVLGVLAIVWIVVLGSYAKERMADRRTDSVSAFRSQISTLQRTHCGPQPVGTVHRARSASAMACAAARRRRKNVLLGLLTAALLTVVLALAAPGVVTIGLATLAVAAFTSYVVLLVDRQRLVTEQHVKVRSIASARPRTVAGRQAAVRQAPVRQAAMHQAVLSASRR